MKYFLSGAFLVALAGVSVVLFTRKLPEPGFPLNSVVSAPSEHAIITPRTPPAGHKEYVSQKYMFSLFYPADMQVAERDEGSGASTITFQNPEKAEGFQIFILPYAGDQVTDAQFKKDIPSGVRLNVAEINVDRAIGAAFDSTDPTLGDTHEIWFIKNTYLYEATTVQSFKTGLEAVIESWQFI